VKIAGRRQRLVALESVAMTDIVLNLFIFFFISFSLLYTLNADRAHAIRIVLPAAESAAPPPEAPEARVTVTQSGELYLDGERIGEEALGGEIALRKSADPDLRISLRADRQAPFQEAVRVLSIVSACRVRALDIAVVKEGDADR
jgi:biopolymer transport protein ExbD